MTKNPTSSYFEDPTIKAEIENYPVVSLGDGWYLHMIPETHPMAFSAFEIDPPRLMIFKKAAEFGWSAHLPVRREKDEDVPYDNMSALEWNTFAMMAGIRWFYENSRRFGNLGEVLNEVDKATFLALLDRLRNPMTDEHLTVNTDELNNLYQQHQLKFHLTDEDVFQEIEFWKSLLEVVQQGQPTETNGEVSWYTAQSIAEEAMPEGSETKGTGGNLRMLGLPDAEAVPHFTEYGGATYRHKVNDE
jgi:hypothetical protein